VREGCYWGRKAFGRSREEAVERRTRTGEGEPAASPRKGRRRRGKPKGKKKPPEEKKKKKNRSSAKAGKKASLAGISCRRLTKKRRDRFHVDRRKGEEVRRKRKTAIPSPAGEKTLLRP